MKNLLKYIAISTAAMALLCATSGRVNAAAVNADAIDASFIALNNGAQCPTGDLIQMGQFSISDSAIAALQTGQTITPAGLATLLGAFIPLSGTASRFMGNGTTDVGAGFPNGFPGAYSTSFSGTNAAFATGPIYMMFFNAATSGAASQVLVVRGDSQWTYPADMATGSVGIELNHANSPLLGSATTGRPHGDWTWNDADGNGNLSLRSLNMDTIVPEPSSITLVGLGILGAIGMIRRRRS